MLYNNEAACEAAPGPAHGDGPLTSYVQGTILTFEGVILHAASNVTSCATVPASPHDGPPTTLHSGEIMCSHFPVAPRSLSTCTQEAASSPRCVATDSTSNLWHRCHSFPLFRVQNACAPSLGCTSREDFCFSSFRHAPDSSQSLHRSGDDFTTSHGSCVAFTPP